MWTGLNAVTTLESTWPQDHPERGGEEEAAAVAVSAQPRLSSTKLVSGQTALSRLLQKLYNVELGGKEFESK
jgi:hypothetical protein